MKMYRLVTELFSSSSCIDTYFVYFYTRCVRKWEHRRKSNQLLWTRSINL